MATSYGTAASPVLAVTEGGSVTADLATGAKANPAKSARQTTLANKARSPVYLRHPDAVFIPGDPSGRRISSPSRHA
jgi:hypothetical protein